MSRRSSFAAMVMPDTMQACINIADFRHLARRRLPGPIVDYIDGAAEDEQTLSRNRSTFREWALLPRTMQDVSSVDASTRVMEQDIAWPFVVGPTGMSGLLHPDGEIGLARAVEKVGCFYSLSTMASCSIEEVAAATSGPRAFQLYLFRDRGITLELLQRAKAAGYKAIILTVDVQIPANRGRDRRSGMVIPPKFGLRTLFDFARCPLWCWNVLVKRPVVLANFTGARADPGVPLLTLINQQFEPSIGWQDLEWVAQQWGGPVAIKGVLSEDDSERAVEHGASTIIVSNHGGRQLDAAVAPIDMLPAVVERLDGPAEIIVDGGIRRGTDMLKAIVLGVNACMAGRIGLYGLGAAGGDGAAAALGVLRAEFERKLALLGVTRVSQVDRARVRHIGVSARPPGGQNRPAANRLDSERE